MEPITRAQLQALEAKVKRDTLLRSVQPIYDIVKRCANRGHKSVFFELVNEQKHRGEMNNVYANDPNNINNMKIYLQDTDGSICILQELFPDSKVELQENWVDVTPTNRVLKKGILIDWS